MRTMLMLLLATLWAFVAGRAEAQGPIKIGFISPLTGAIAAAGKDMYSGCELYWQENGWQMAGRKVEVVLEDNEGNPATALVKARKLVGREQRDDLGAARRHDDFFFDPRGGDAVGGRAVGLDREHHAGLQLHRIVEGVQAADDRPLVKA